MDAVISLVSTTYVMDAYGIRKPTRTSRTVFCTVDSVSRSEFYDAGRNGFNPEYRFTMFAGDYDGESVCTYEGQDFAIYRAYHIPGTDYMELYVQREGGTNGATS